MAKPATVLIKLVSTAGTGFFYTTKKNPRKTTEKLALRKYDPEGAQARRVQGSQDQVGFVPAMARRSSPRPARAFRLSRAPRRARHYPDLNQSPRECRPCLESEGG